MFVYVCVWTGREQIREKIKDSMESGEGEVTSLRPHTERTDAS